MTITLSKETSLFQKDKITTDVTDAGTKATDYITKIDNNGLYVSPKSQSPSSGSEGNSVKINGDGLEVFVGGTSVAKYGTSARIGATNSVHNVIDSSGLTIKNGSTNLAKFNAGNISVGSSIAGTEISAAGAIGIYPSGGTAGLRMAKINGETTFTYGDALHFSSQPYVKARSTNANISLSSSTITKVPMTYIDSEHGNGDFMSVNNGNVRFDSFDGFAVEATASAYVQPSSNAFVYIFLYHYSQSNNTTTEVGAGCNYISSAYGGVVQLTPRIITPIYLSDYLYISVRCIGTTGTAYCNHKDTFLTVKFL